MVRTKDSIKMVGTTDILGILSSIVEKLYKEYRVMNISREVFLSITSNNLIQLKQFLSENEIIDQEELKCYFQTIIDGELSKTLDDKSCYLMLDNFINNQVQHSHQITSSQLLIQMGQFLNRFNYIPSANFYEELLTKNGVLLEVLDNMDLINNDGELKDDKVDSLPIDVNIQGLIDTYQKLKGGNENIPVEDETLGLVTKAQNGDPLATEKLIERNFGLVRSQANKFLGRGLDYDDLFQEGCIGLMNAIKKFDISKGFTFSTFAYPSIKNQIQLALSTNFKEKTGTAHHLYHGSIAYRKASDELKMELNRTPTLQEISSKTKLSKQSVKTIESIEKGPISLNDLVSSDLQFELETLLSSPDKQPDEESIHNQFIKKFYELFDSVSLSYIERQTLIYGYGLFDNDSINNAEIGRRENCSREWIRRKHASAIKKLRQSPLLAEFNIYSENPDTCLQQINYFETQAELAAKSKKKQKNKKQS